MKGAVVSCQAIEQSLDSLIEALLKNKENDPEWILRSAEWELVGVHILLTGMYELDEVFRKKVVGKIQQAKDAIEEEREKRREQSWGKSLEKAMLM